MRELLAMDTIQIEITNICENRCANCTRFVGYAKPYYMSMNEFKQAVDSMAGFPNMVGIMGGEPLMHPLFKDMCEYALEKIPRMQLGLWTCFPARYRDYREVIAKTFGNIFLNDHTRGDVYHHPFLVASKEVVPDATTRMKMIKKCFFQDAWSAAINPNGAFFCEIAASLSTLFGGRGDAVLPRWWERTVDSFRGQIETFCEQCGGAMPLQRRVSVEEVDDISPANFKRIPRKSSRLKIHDLKMVEQDALQALASYKDPLYRDAIAARYDMRLSLNAKCFNEPHLGKSLYRKLKEHYA